MTKLQRRTNRKNQQLQALIKSLVDHSKEHDVKLWRRVADDLSKPSRDRRTVNVFKIEQHAEDGETVIVPGKVLGQGTLTKDITVAAYKFSASAKDSINQAGTAQSIEELLEDNPAGKNIRIIG